MASGRNSSGAEPLLAVDVNPDFAARPVAAAGEDASNAGLRRMPTQVPWDRAVSGKPLRQNERAPPRQYGLVTRKDLLNRCFLL